MAKLTAAQMAEGDAVQIADRDPNAADTKSGLFYPHYRGLTGTLTKLYADGTANITVDPESLPAEIRARHQAGTTAMRQKWLDGLSDEARNKLSGAEKKFSLRYSLLAGISDLSAIERVAQTDLELENPPARKKAADLDDAEARHLAEAARRGA